jgi:hypothetical protein
MLVVNGIKRVRLRNAAAEDPGRHGLDEPVAPIAIR